MLTLFAIPKPFRGHVGAIQRNAIRSWTLLHPACEVILFGQDEGTAEIALELGTSHVPIVACNEYGTPLVNGLFAQAERMARHDVLCYVNADIILMSDFPVALRRAAVGRRRFLLTGRRWNVDLEEPLGFGGGWDERLREYVGKHGQLFSWEAMDYFAFPRGLWGTIPPFAIGRTVWDNWLLFGARERGARLIDSTTVVMAVHQNHDYAHHALGEAGVWRGVEAQRNLELAGGWDHVFTLQDATWLLGRRGLSPALSRWHLARHIETWAYLFPGLRRRLRLFRRVLLPLWRFSKAALARTSGIW